MTALELIATAGITTAFLVAALPASATILQGFKLRGAARNVFAQLQKARMDAVTNNDRYRWSKVTGSSYQYKIHQDRNGNGIEDGGEPVTTRDLFADGAGVTLSASGPVVFAPNGTAPTPGTITLTNRYGQSRTLSVNSAGRIQIS